MSTRPRILAILPHVIPSTIIYLLKPLTALHKEARISAEFALEYSTSRRQIQRADAVMFCRNIEPAYGGALNAALELGKPIIYELDDNLFELSAHSKAEEHYKDPAKQDQLRRYLKSANLIRVYSEHLKQIVSEINPNVVRVDGPVDWNLVASSLESCRRGTRSVAPRGRPQKRAERSPPCGQGAKLRGLPDRLLAARKAHEKVRIVYATGRTHDELANIFIGDVERLLATHADQVELFFWGYRCDRLAKHPSVHFLNYVTNYDRYLRAFSRYSFDIGLAPLPNDDFHLSKSNVKFREYAACRVAGIYSNVPVYSECVEDGVTGLLVQNEPGAWHDALVRLIADENLRRSIQERAQGYARERFNQDKYCDVLLEQIQALLSKRVVSPPVLRSVESGEVGLTGNLINIIRHSLELAPRFLRSIKKIGLQESILRARWALNDLSILNWNRRVNV